MSAQALNASSYSGYSGGTSSGNPSGAVPTRDASDITRQIKERLIYNAFNGVGSVTPGTPSQIQQRPQLNPAGVNHIPGNSEWSWLPYGNQFRLSYFFGKMKNSTVAGGAVTGSASTWTYAVAQDPRPLGFKAGGYVNVTSPVTPTNSGYAAVNLGTFLISSVTATTIVITNSLGSAETKSGYLSLCPAGLFNGNGPKLPVFNGSNTTV